MKRKYYLRGLGFGILITTFVFILVGPSELSEKEIIQRAEQLGYVKAEETGKPTINLEELLNKDKEEEQASGSQLTIIPSPSETVITGTITPEPTKVSEQTITPIQTIMPEDTQTVTQKPMGTVTPTVTVTSKPTNTVKPTATATLKPTNTVKPTVTATPKPTSTVKPTVTTTPKPTVTVKLTATATPKPTVTVKPTATVTSPPKVTTKVTPIPTITPKLTVKPTATTTPKPTNTVKPTSTVTPKPTVTPTSKKEDVITAKIRITMGSSAMAVCKQLEKAGIIESADEMIQYLADINKAAYIDIGTYTLSSDMSLKEIADIITID